MLTRTGWGTVVVAFAAFGIGRVFGILELFVLGAGVLTVVIAAVAASMRRAPRLAVRRLLSPATVQASEASRVDVQVENVGVHRTPMIELWEPVGDTGGATMQLAPLRSGERAVAAYRLPTERRGVVRVGPMWARRRDVLGLCARSFTVPGNVELLVLPRHVPAPFALGGSSGRLGEHLRLRAQGQAGSEFHSLREYVIGDDLRRINWKASARSNDLIVKETAVEGVRRCTVVVDLDPDAADADAFERMISAAASLVTGAFAVGLTTRLVAEDVDLRGPDVAPVALRWLATAEQRPTGTGTLPNLHTSEGMGLLVVVTGSTNSACASLVRASVGPEDTLVLVVASRFGGDRDRFVVDATGDETFAAGWASLVGAASSGRRLVGSER
jgi:uncharacterized protein (DUF58 family)